MTFRQHQKFLLKYKKYYSSHYLKTPYSKFFGQAPNVLHLAKRWGGRWWGFHDSNLISALRGQWPHPKGGGVRFQSYSIKGPKTLQSGIYFPFAYFRSTNYLKTQNLVLPYRFNNQKCSSSYFLSNSIFSLNKRWYFKIKNPRRGGLNSSSILVEETFWWKNLQCLKNAQNYFQLLRKNNRKQKLKGCCFRFYGPLPPSRGESTYSKVYQRSNRLKIQIKPFAFKCYSSDFLKSRRADKFRPLKRNGRVRKNFAPINENTISTLAKRERFIRNSLKGVLLVNFPEKEKNFLIKNLAAENKIALITQSASLLLKDSRNMDDLLGVDDPIQILFDKVKTCIPCICFINNLDRIGKQRYEQEPKYLHWLNNSISSITNHNLMEQRPLEAFNHKNRCINRSAVRGGITDYYYRLPSWLSNSYSRINQGSGLESSGLEVKPFSFYNHKYPLGKKKRVLDLQSSTSIACKFWVFDQNSNSPRKQVFFQTLSSKIQPFRFPTNKRQWPHPEGSLKGGSAEFLARRLEERSKIVFSKNSVFKTQTLFIILRLKQQMARLRPCEKRVLAIFNGFQVNALTWQFSFRDGFRETKRLLKPKSGSDPTPRVVENPAGRDFPLGVRPLPDLLLFYPKKLLTKHNGLNQNRPKLVSQATEFVKTKNSVATFNYNDKAWPDKTSISRAILVERPVFSARWWGNKNTTASRREPASPKAKSPVFFDSKNTATANPDPPVPLLRGGGGSPKTTAFQATASVETGFFRLLNRTGLNSTKQNITSLKKTVTNKRPTTFNLQTNTGMEYPKNNSLKITETDIIKRKSLLKFLQILDGFHTPTEKTKRVAWTSFFSLARAGPLAYLNLETLRRGKAKHSPQGANTRGAESVLSVLNTKTRMRYPIILNKSKIVGNSVIKTPLGVRQPSIWFPYGILKTWLKIPKLNRFQLNKKNYFGNQVGFLQFFSKSLRVLEDLKRGRARVPDPLVPLPHLQKSAPGSQDPLGGGRTFVGGGGPRIRGKHGCYNIRTNNLPFKIPAGTRLLSIYKNPAGRVIKPKNPAGRVLGNVYYQAMLKNQTVASPRGGFNKITRVNDPCVSDRPSFRRETRKKTREAKSLPPKDSKSSITQNSKLGLFKKFFLAKPLYRVFEPRNISHNAVVFPAGRNWTRPFRFPTDKSRRILGSAEFLARHPEGSTNSYINISTLLVNNYKISSSRGLSLYSKKKTWWETSKKNSKAVAWKIALNTNAFQPLLQTRFLPKWEIFLKDQSSNKSLNLLCVWPSYIEEILGPFNLNDNASYILPEYFQLLGHGFKLKKPKITLIASTNNLTTLDAALLRPGRFDTIINFGPPPAGAGSRPYNFSAPNSGTIHKPSKMLKHSPHTASSTPSLRTSCLVWNKEDLEWNDRQSLTQANRFLGDRLYNREREIRPCGEAVAWKSLNWPFKSGAFKGLWPTSPYFDLPEAEIELNFGKLKKCLDKPHQSSSLKTFIDVSIFIQYKLWWSSLVFSADPYPQGGLFSVGKRNDGIRKNTAASFVNSSIGFHPIASPVWSSLFQRRPPPPRGEVKPQAEPEKTRFNNAKASWLGLNQKGLLEKPNTSEVILMLKTTIKDYTYFWMGFLQMIYAKFFYHFFQFWIILKNKPPLGWGHWLINQARVNSATFIHQNSDFVNALAREIMISRAVALGLPKKSDFRVLDTKKQAHYPIKRSLSESSKDPLVKQSSSKFSTLSENLKWDSNSLNSSFEIEIDSLPNTKTLNLPNSAGRNKSPRIPPLPRRNFKNNIHVEQDNLFLKCNRGLLFGTSDFDYKIYTKKKSEIILASEFATSTYLIGAAIAFLDQFSKIWKPFQATAFKKVNLNQVKLNKYNQIYKLKKIQPKQQSFFNLHPFSNLMVEQEQWAEITKSNKLKRYLKVPLVKNIPPQFNFPASMFEKTPQGRNTDASTFYHHKMSRRMFFSCLQPLKKRQWPVRKKNSQMSQSKFRRFGLDQENKQNSLMIQDSWFLNPRRAEFPYSRIYHNLYSVALLVPKHLSLLKKAVACKESSKRVATDSFLAERWSYESYLFKKLNNNLFLNITCLQIYTTFTNPNSAILKLLSEPFGSATVGSATLEKEIYTKHFLVINRFKKIPQAPNASHLAKRWGGRWCGINSSHKHYNFQTMYKTNYFNFETDQLNINNNVILLRNSKEFLVSNVKKQNYFVKTRESVLQDSVRDKNYNGGYGSARQNDPFQNSSKSFNKETPNISHLVKRWGREIPNSKMCRLDVTFFLLTFYIMFFEKIQYKKITLSTIKIFMPYKSLIFSHFLLSQSGTHGFSCKNFEILICNKFQNFLTSGNDFKR